MMQKVKVETVLSSLIMTPNRIFCGHEADG
jgi:hypothetical protein